jgi:hypothetical protein
VSAGYAPKLPGIAAAFGCLRPTRVRTGSQAARAAGPHGQPGRTGSRAAGRDADAVRGSGVTGAKRRPPARPTAGRQLTGVPRSEGLVLPPQTMTLTRSPGWGW